MTDNQIIEYWMIKGIGKNHPARKKIKQFAKANHLTLAGAIIKLAEKI